MERKTLILTFLIFLIITNILIAQTPNYQVIVNTSNPVSSISKAKLSKLFLKKITKWDDGKKVLIVDQLESSQVRVVFTKNVLGKSVSAIKSYWQQQLFSGNATPPPKKESDEIIINYIKENPGSIGYVSDKADIKGVKVLKIAE